MSPSAPASAASSARTPTRALLFGLSRAEVPLLMELLHRLPADPAPPDCLEGTGSPGGPGSLDGRVVTGCRASWPLQPLSTAEARTYDRLHQRGLITLLAHRPTGTMSAAWTHAGSSAAAARALVRHYGQGPLAAAIIARSQRQGRPGTLALTPSAAAIVLSWHYRHTSARTLTLTHEPPTNGPARLRLDEEHSNGATIERHLSLAAAPGMEVTPRSDYDDDGAVLQEQSVAYYAAALIGPGHGVRLNLESLEVRGIHPDHTFAHDCGPGPLALPGLTLDALAFYRAPHLATATDLTTWASANLVLDIGCVKGMKHRLVLDPHTHDLHPATPTARTRHDADHFLAALSGPAEHGCDLAALALTRPSDISVFDDDWPTITGAHLTAARTIARTVQYLDAGLDLQAAAPFLRWGLDAPQTAWAINEQTRAPQQMRARLLQWARATHTGAPINPNSP